MTYEIPQQGVLVDRALPFALTVCCEAGEILRAIRSNGDLAVEQKTGFELVTRADLAVDRHFRQRIAAEFADHVILSEESVEPQSPRQVPCWIIDPLDGTMNFIHGQDHVAVSAALSVGGQVVLGVVHAPFHGQTFWALKGRGAYRDGRKIETSRLTDIGQALIATGFPHDRAHVDALVDRLKPILRTFGDIRRLAAPALDICWVADGRLTGFIDRIHIWDVAAAGLIATEAGARLLSLQSDPSRARAEGTDYVIAAPGIFGQLCEILDAGALPLR